MKLKYFIFGCLLLCFEGNLYGQINHSERLTLPFFDPASQSNVVVIVCDQDGKPCPGQYTNLISNTNLFTRQEQKLLNEVMTKYKNVTTNIGPPGSRLVSLDKTNYVTSIVNRTNSCWRAIFEYPNSGTREEVAFVQDGIAAKFQDKSGNGYVVGLEKSDGNSMLGFGQVNREGTLEGLRVEIVNSILQSYMRYTNGLAIGKYFIWNPRNNNIIIEAEFKEPYDLEKHKVPFTR